ncbi:MAG: SDR family oxidoreductase [Leptospiraceae bacterium]|nr:SDR family oxidoreductase [Leptospiraceae bacterium]
MSNIVITGANRGIGFGLAKEFSKSGHNVIGVCRNASNDMRNHCSEVLDGYDVTKEESLTSLYEKLSGTKIDILINNAGILQQDSLSQLPSNSLLDQFKVNAMAPILLTSKILPLIQKPGKVVVITSRMGSIADNGSGGYYGYRMSKAAVNAAFVSLARDLASSDIHVAIIHPGMVATEMTGRQGIPVEEAVSGIVHRINELNASSSGKFYHQNGEELPW